MIVIVGDRATEYGLHAQTSVVVAGDDLRPGDIRLPVGVTTDVLIAKLDQWLGPLDGVSWRAIRRFEPSFTPPDHEIVVRTAKVAHEVLGEAPAVNMRVGGSDSRWYRPAGVPTVVLGLTPYNMGGADEHVVVEELLAVAKIHTLVAFDFLTAGP